MAAWLPLPGVLVALLLAAATGSNAQVFVTPAGAHARAGPPVLAPPARLLYVWDGTIAGDPVRTAALLAFAASRDVTTVAIEASDVGYALPGAQLRFTSFAGSAHMAGIAVLALNGYPWFGTACGAVPGQPTCMSEGWGVYQTIANSGVPFDGILDDTEPYGADFAHWITNLPSRAQQYLDFLRGVDLRIGAMPFVHAMPFWYDEDAQYVLAIDGEAQPHPLNWYVSRIVDVVALMDYRDTALGPNGIIAHAQGEMATGPCIVGIETDDLGPGNDVVTFWEEGQAAMEAELALVHSAFQADPRYRGLAIHHYGSWPLLGP